MGKTYRKERSEDKNKLKGTVKTYKGRKIGKHKRELYEELYEDDSKERFFSR